MNTLRFCINHYCQNTSTWLNCHTI